MLVMSAVALASLLAFALLSGAMVQSRTSANAARVQAADCLAESGINLAMYYLQNPAQATLNAQGYWAGTGGDIAIGTGVAGTVNVSVVRDAANTWTYEVTSTGKSGMVDGAQVTRTAQARIYVRNEYQLQYAAGFNQNTTLWAYTTIDGSVLCNRVLTLKSNSSLTGTAYCQSASLPVGMIVTTASVPSGAIGSPTNADVNLYSTYTWQSAAKSADTIPAATTSLTGTAGIPTRSASASNPAGVWLSQPTGGTLTLGDHVTIDGTLVVQGNLTINGAGIVITPKSGFPALIVTGTLQVNQPSKSLTVHGICYVGTTLKSFGIPANQSVSSQLRINGGLLIGGATPITTNYNAATYVKLDPSLCLAPELSATGRVPVGASILRWGPAVSAY